MDCFWASVFTKIMAGEHVFWNTPTGSEIQITYFQCIKDQNVWLFHALKVYTHFDEIFQLILRPMVCTIIGQKFLRTDVSFVDK